MGVHLGYSVVLLDTGVGGFSGSGGMTNFQVYLRFYSRGELLDVGSPGRRDMLGRDARQAFALFDNCGQVVSTRHPRVLQAALTGKAQLNFQIKQWAEGIAAGLFCLPEFQEEWPWLPNWVWRSVKNQCLRITGKPVMAPFEWYYSRIFQEKSQEWCSETGQ